MSQSVADRVALLLAATVLLTVAWLARAAAPDEDRRQAVARLHRGQTREQVQQILGPPRRIARQIFYQRHLEQWVYDQVPSVRLEFDCRRGREDQLIDIQPLTPGRQ